MIKFAMLMRIHKAVCVGGIKCKTPADGSDGGVCTPRVVNPHAVALRGSFGHIPIISYITPQIKGLQKVSVEGIQSIDSSSVELASLLSYAKAVESIWVINKWLGVPACPSWNGYMNSVIHTETDYTTSSIITLPFINLNPNAPTTIYSSLLYANEICTKYKQITCI
jgi:hypothetical protein